MTSPGGAVGALWVEVGAKVAPGADKTIHDGIVPPAEKTGQEAGRKIGDGLKKALKFAVAAVGTASIINIFRDSIAEASDLAEAINKADVVIGSASASVMDFASNAALSLGQSRSQALEAAADFAVFGKAAGLGGEALADFSTEMVALASDMASFSNTSPEQAIIAIGAAFRGETEPIRAYGVLMDDASLRQKAFELGLTSTTKNALQPQQRILAAHALILEQTTDAQGDFAAQSGEVANSQKILTALWTDAKAELGAGLLPAVKQFLMALREAMPAIQAFVTSVGSIAGSGLTVAVPLLQLAASTIEWLDDVIPGGAASVAAYVAAWAAFRRLGGVNELFSTMGARIGALSMQMGASEGAAVKAAQGFGRVGSVISSLGMIAPVVGLAWGLISSAINQYSENVETATKATRPMYDALAQGGAAAAVAQADLAAFNATAQAYIDRGGPVADIGHAMAEGQKEAAKSYREAQKSMSPLEKQQQALTKAQNDYQYAVEQHGETSEQAAAAALALQQANAKVEATQEGVTKATQNSTQALQEYMSQQLAAVSSDYAAQLAAFQVIDAQEEYNKVLQDGAASSRDKQAAEISLGQAVIAAAEAEAKKAAETAKAAGVTDTAAAENEALLSSLEAYAAEAGANTPAAISTLIAELKNGTGAANTAAGAADNAAGSVAGAGGAASTASTQIGGFANALRNVPTKTSPSVNANGNYKEATGQISGLGSAIANLKDKTVTITTRTIGGIGGGLVPQLATGGAVHGPGTGVSDSILARLSNGEHVLTADDVRSAGGQRAIYDLRRMIQAGWRVPGYATGGAVGSPQPVASAPRLDGPVLIQIEGIDGLLRGTIRRESRAAVSDYDREQSTRARYGVGASS